MAVRITLKRSSILNKRPNADLLDPGELALNTNALSPGLFFEADNNSVVKVGPTAVGLTEPTPIPSLGETYYQEATRTLSIGTNGDPDEVSLVWRKISAPYLGGTNGYVVFVAPEFPSANDSIFNDGQSSPFATLNRAILEVGKQSIRIQNEQDRAENNRYTVVVAPGISPVYNGPGHPIREAGEEGDTFMVNFESINPSEPTVLNLQQFNPESGGLLLPRGTSVVGMDLRKVELRPTYVPTYQNPTTKQGVYQTRSAIIKWTGNSLVSSLTFRDKREEVSIVDIHSGASGEGVFISGRPHCFGLNDKVFFKFTPGATTTPLSGNSAQIGSGEYYVYPVGTYEFMLSFVPVTDTNANYVERSQLPVAPQGGLPIATCTWDIYSHNRLRALFCATETELDEFYVKVQKAFPVTFEGKTNQAEVVNPGETQIVAPVPFSPEESLQANSSSNASAYTNNVSVRSNYGMCGVEHDGNLVTGFRSVQAGLFTHISIQNDPVAYEIYTTIQDPGTGELSTNWYTLQYATWATLPTAVRPEAPLFVTREQQLEVLNTTNLSNIRWYYETQKSQTGESFGIPDLDRDFRHFSVRALSSAFAQVANAWSVASAVGFWSYGGGRMALNNCSSNFGSMAIRTEGFSGLGQGNPIIETYTPDTGFVFGGIRMPLRLTAADTQSFRILELGPNATSVANTDNGVQEITLGPGFQPINILPFALSPETGIYVLWGSEEYRAFFVNDATPPVTFRGDGTTVLRVRSIDSSFPIGTLATNPTMQEWSSPFIKRWRDPRNITESSYSLILDNTNPNHSQPAVGDVLRLNQSTAAAARLLRPGVQLDPGSSGGWGRVFQVAYSQASVAGDSPQFNEVLLNRQSASSHYVALSLCDSGRPWLQDFDHAHGSYVTYANRNWYAAANDAWKGIYYSIDGVQPEALKLNPLEYNSPWATTYCTEKLELVDDTFQGLYAVDEEIDIYPEGSKYFRGDQPAPVNYGFEFGYNEDNGSPSFGLLKYNLPSPDSTTTTEILPPESNQVTVAQVKDVIPSPFRQYIVVALTDADSVEYCQVVGADEDTNTLTLIRGLYGTTRDTDWPIDTTVTVQLPGSLVDPVLYDVDWAPSKESIIRFLRVMGYSLKDISQLLRPQFPSSRNVRVETISLTPDKGYAVSSGPWPLQLAYASQVDVSAHSMHSVGTINYSRGLPQYNQGNIPTKQYYDLLCARVWGGTGSISSIDEEGSIPLSGTFTQIETGRPYGSNTSLINNSDLSDNTNGSGGGGGSGDGVTAVFTGPGLVGGPIFSTGVISLSPPAGGNIGGVKEGPGVSVAGDGTLSVAPPAGDQIGGVKAGTNITITPDGTISAKEDATLAIVPLDDISRLFDGTTVSFALANGGNPVTPESSFYVMISVGGIMQGAPVNYGVTGSTITFSSAPPRNATFYGVAFIRVAAPG